MQQGRVNILLDAQWGSSGKGKFAAWLAATHRVRYASSSNAPNAGHTVVIDGKPIVFKCLPAAVMAPSVKVALLTGASVFSVAQLALEVESVGRFVEPRPGRVDSIELIVHDRAVLLQQKHRDTEAHSDGLRSIASTMQGSAAAAIDKILRCPSVVAGAQPYLHSLLDIGVSVVKSAAVCRQRVAQWLADGDAILHEVAQGFALSIDHGSHYPQCTSRNCTTARGLDDLGVNPRLLGDVYLNVRPYPIRVGHLREGDRIIGYSGGGYADCSEIDWETIGQRAGMPPEEIVRLSERELTTVTKRLRRAFTFSEYGFAEAARTNGATKILLNFAQYLDWGIAGEHGTIYVRELPPKIRSFVCRLEQLSGCPVVAVGTGAGHHDVLTISRDE